MPIEVHLVALILSQTEGPVVALLLDTSIMTHVV